MTRTFISIILPGLLALPGSLLAASVPVTVSIAIPAITCTSHEDTHDCILSGELMARGPENLTKPVKYYCDIRYRYVAAGNDTNSIRFDGRLIRHAEVTLINGRLRRSISEPVQLNLPKKAKNVSLTSIACEME